MPTAYLHMRNETHYRHEAFLKGLRSLGFETQTREPVMPVGVDDVAIIWNKTSWSKQTIAMAREGGGALIVCENGYHGQDDEGRQNYAMALDGHNGSGRWWSGPINRFSALDIKFEPWRQLTGSSKVLIAAQRGIGSPRMASPQRFEDDTQRLLMRMGYTPVLRGHPGRNKVPTTLLEDLEGCRGLVVWSSNCATEALIAGYPVYYCAPHIVTQGAAVRLSHAAIKTLAHGERSRAFHNLAWGQWSIAEIESGEAIGTLLRVHRGELPAQQAGLGI